jgi:hypothetical protein
MPLDSIEAYDRLGEHLAVIDAPLAAFAAKHGYTVYPRLSGGRYQHAQEVSIVRTDTCLLCAALAHAERRASATPRHWRPAWNRAVIAGFAARALLGDLIIAFVSASLPSPAQSK